MSQNEYMKDAKRLPITAEVPKPEPVAYGFGNTAITGHTNRLMMVRIDIPGGDQYAGAFWLPLVLADEARTYGEDCFSAGYVAGVKAENARCKQILTAKREHYDALPDRVLAAQCFDHAQILLGGWAYEAALRGEVKL